MACLMRATAASIPGRVKGSVVCSYLGFKKSGVRPRDFRRRTNNLFILADCLVRLISLLALDDDGLKLF